VSRGIALPRAELLPQVADVAAPLTADSARRGTSVLDPAGLVLAAGAAATFVLITAQLDGSPVLGLPAENLHVLVSAGAVAAAMAMLARRPGRKVLNFEILAAAALVTALGQMTLDAVPRVSLDVAAPVANVAFAIATAISAVTILPALYGRLDQRTAASAGLDGGIILVTGVTILVTLWLTGETVPNNPVELALPLLGAILFASAGVAVISALDMRIAPAPRGIWCGIAGVLIIGASWVLWIDSTLHGLPRDGLASLLYSVGMLVLGYAWMTWAEEASAGGRYLRLAQSLADWLPIAAILACVVFAAVPHGRVNGIDPVPAGTATVIMLTIARQRLLILGERWASRRLAREVEERAQTMLSLARLEQADTLEATASRVCDEALRLGGIDAAAVYSFTASGAVVPLALGGAVRADECVGEPIGNERAMHLRACASQGTWVDRVGTGTAPPDESRAGEVFAPMRWDDRIVGVVAVATGSPRDALRLSERMPTFTEFGVVSSALMGPMLAEQRRVASIRESLDRVIQSHAFTPVFQAVVQLADRSIVGYEALTRFTDGTRPDVRFLEAHSAGMSVRLELTCLIDQVDAAVWLPEGAWVSLNVSPALASGVVPLIAVLERAEREVVLEITEHVEIGDYRQLVAALDLIRGHARLAVDDAGAGYAGLRHILELHPQFVKLDLSLVRNIDTDPARQAMVAGMAHFARDSGCELIAEGIETQQELNELIRLGVRLGQGYLLGKPRRVG
jgi:EAL domain-containing protein (putative c-di-GMP-specific phosphodiesterase class I)